MQGFGEIRDSQVLNRQPVRLTLQSVTRPAQLRDQLPKNLPAPFTAEDVALLNQSQLNQEIAPGKVLKLPAAR